MISPAQLCCDVHISTQLCTSQHSIAHLKMAQHNTALQCRALHSTALLCTALPTICEQSSIPTLYCFADDSGESEEEQSCGTTATVMLVRQDKIVVANIGDSRAVLSRAGQAIDLSTEHRYSVAPDSAQKLCMSCMPASAGCLRLAVALQI